jgi:hypothetical protein
MNLDTREETNGRIEGKSGPPGNMNAFKHGLAAIQKRREESITTSTRKASGNRLDGCMIGLNDTMVQSHRIDSWRSIQFNPAKRDKLVAVGTALASSPPHRSVCEGLPHTALTSGSYDGLPLVGIRMHYQPPPPVPSCRLSYAPQPL